MNHLVMSQIRCAIRGLPSLGAHCLDHCHNSNNQCAVEDEESDGLFQCAFFTEVK